MAQSRQGSKGIYTSAPLPAAGRPSDLLNTIEAARYLRVSDRTLTAWRTRGGGPVYNRVGARMVRYHIGALDAFLAEGLRRNTSEGGK